MHGQLVRRVHDYLLETLSPEAYPQGAHLNPRIIAEELDVSRTTVNKALRKLVELGVARREGSRLVVGEYPQRTGATPQPLAFQIADETERIYRAIRERMLHGGFRVGRSVNARKLADDLGTTIQIVRQALNQATAAGMFERRPRRGWIAVQHTARDIHDIYRVRLTLEPMLVKWVVSRITDHQIDDLATRIQVLQQAAEVPRSELREADYQFHRTFMDVANRRIITGILDPMIHKLFLQPSVRQPSDTLAEHAEILQAIRARDADLAARHLRAHLRNSRRSYAAAANSSRRSPLTDGGEIGR
jgi:DNA-binding GntR family transcriptional regulator